MTERQDAGMRLLDVLLEEELGGARATVPPRRSPWLWAAALLGVGVVVGIACLRPPASASRATQDPAAPSRFLPADAAAFRAAIATMQSVSLAPRERPKGVPLLGGLPLVGNLFRKDATPAGALQDPASTVVLARFVVPATGLPAWREALLGCTDGGVEGDANDPVAIDLTDGRRLDCLLTTDLLLVRGDGKNLLLRAPQALLDLREAAARSELARQRHELGIALDAAALNAFPTGQTSLSMPPDPELVAAALARLPKLERLRLLDPATDQVPWDQLAPVLGASRSLRALHVPAHGLGDVHLAALQPIGLRELEFDGALTGITASSFGGFDRLESLAIPAVGEGVAIAEVLGAAKTLHRVELGADLWRDELVEPLLRLPIEHLRIGGSNLNAAALARLPSLPHLRRLDLFVCQIGDDELMVLGAIPLLTDLRLRMVAWYSAQGMGPVDLGTLQRRLPKCTIVDDGM